MDIEQDIFKTAIDGKVLVAPGSWFASERDKPITDIFFRATFAAAGVSFRSFKPISSPFPANMSVHSLRIWTKLFAVLVKL